MRAVVWSLVFLLINLVAPFIVVRLKKRQRAAPKADPAPSQPPTGPTLDFQHILEWEHEYIRNTASEAMQDRHTMINFYLLLVGVVASGILANFDKLGKSESGATLLLWSVCFAGWFHFLILVRLREAWHDSMRALLKMREFCVRHAKGFSPKEAMGAFLWRLETLPEPDKPLSVFHFSALLIGLLDSMAFGIGGYLLSVAWGTVCACTSALLVGMSLVLFLYHIWVYSALLKRKVQSAGNP